jgi:DNA primase large subunit
MPTINDSHVSGQIRTFRQWANQAKITDDPVGDFIADFNADKKAPYDYESLDRLRLYLEVKGACPEAIAAARRAWKRYQRWVRSSTKDERTP